MCRLSQHTWPGNVRELENIIEYGVCLETTPVLQESTVGQRLEEMDEEKIVISPLSKMVRNFEKKLVNEALDKFKGDRSPIGKAAKVLGISKATLYRKISNSQY
jgi:transcriptional regulator with PAS, ATPase and Fis domain